MTALNRQLFDAALTAPQAAVATPSGPLRLTPEEISEIRCRMDMRARVRGFDPHRIDDASLTDAECIRRLYREVVGECTVLNAARLAAYVQARVDHSFLAIYWAVSAYGDHLKTDKFHKDNPNARRSLESFLGHDRLDHWVERGRDLYRKRHGRQVVEQRRTASGESDLDRWTRLSPQQRQRLLDEAAGRLQATYPKMQFVAAETDLRVLREARLLAALERKEFLSA